MTSWYRNFLTFADAELTSSHSIENLIRTGFFPLSVITDVWDTFIRYFGSSASESRTTWPKGLFRLSSWTWIEWVKRRLSEPRTHNFDACRRLLTKKIQCCDSMLSEYLIHGWIFNQFFSLVAHFQPVRVWILWWFKWLKMLTIFPQFGRFASRRSLYPPKLWHLDTADWNCFHDPRWQWQKGRTYASRPFRSCVPSCLTIATSTITKYHVRLWRALRAAPNLLPVAPHV